MKHSFPQSDAFASRRRPAVTRPRSWQIGEAIPLASGLLGEVKGHMSTSTFSRPDSLSPNSGGDADHKSASPFAFGAGQESTAPAHRLDRWEPTARDLERFWSKVDRSQLSPGGCWPWIAGLTGVGYGSFAIRAARPAVIENAHRVAFRLEHGRAPLAGKVLRHRCDFEACVNPDHLLEGTQLENVQDCIERVGLFGRPPAPSIHGTRAGYLRTGCRCESCLGWQARHRAMRSASNRRYQDKLASGASR